MCGIVGFSSRIDNAEAVLEQMMDRIRHRGPDAGNGKDFIITSGLEVGDKIVTVGANNVQEGEQVLFPAAPKTEK